jgi:hypothetical protein
MILSIGAERPSHGLPQLVELVRSCCGGQSGLNSWVPENLDIGVEFDILATPGPASSRAPDDRPWTRGRPG